MLKSDYFRIEIKLTEEELNRYPQLKSDYFRIEIKILVGVKVKAEQLKSDYFRIEIESVGVICILKCLAQIRLF